MNNPLGGFSFGTLDVLSRIRSRTFKIEKNVSQQRIELVVSFCIRNEKNFEIYRMLREHMLLSDFYINMESKMDLWYAFEIEMNGTLIFSAIELPDGYRDNLNLQVLVRELTFVIDEYKRSNQIVHMKYSLNKCTLL
uniref:Uncharacterized protein n=3 Tax=Macrostomum lignano TaxID=282301 RepID=A0A1I8GN56_9PLAT